MIRRLGDCFNLVLNKKEETEVKKEAAINRVGSGLCGFSSR